MKIKGADTDDQDLPKPILVKPKTMSFDQFQKKHNITSPPKVSPKPVKLVPKVSPAFSPCMINGISNFSEIIYDDAHNGNSADLTGLRCL